MLSALRLYGNRRPLLRLVSINNRALHPTRRSEFRTNIACRWASLGSILITQRSNSTFVLFLAQARQKRLAGFEGMLDERRCKRILAPEFKSEFDVDKWVVGNVVVGGSNKSDF